MDRTPMTAEELLCSLLQVRQAAVDREERLSAALDGLPPSYRASGVNLAHYLAVRQFDLRREQKALSRLGLSSLGRAEAHVLATLDAVITRLGAEIDWLDLPHDLGRRGPGTDEGDQLLADHARLAVGPPPAGHNTRVMVTLPTEAATDPSLVDQLVEAGMAVARINCAHDGPEQWRAMAGHVREAARRLRRDIRVMFDLPGPKLRIGPLESGPEVVRARPRRDAYGRVQEVARIRFVTEAGADTSGDRPAGADRTVEVPAGANLVEGAQPGDRLRFVDSRDRKRSLEIVRVGPAMMEAICNRTTYLHSHMAIERCRGGTVVAPGHLGGLPPTPAVIRLRRGEQLELRLGDKPGQLARRYSDGEVAERSCVSVDVPELFANVRVGERILIDDGEIESVVRAVSPNLITVEIVRPRTANLRAEKGINLPDTTVDIPALTNDDLGALEMVAPLADLIALSYIGRSDDVDRFQAALDRLGSAHVGLILKVEHRSAFDALPNLLLRALRRPPAAVMVARGDLAVEVGFERLAELQEEILWLSEAAHVPVIWATQVLESLAKRGAPTRAEVTDAARSGRAECVMLNKGPHIPEAIRFLHDILARMQEHQDKRTPMLRPLAVAWTMGPVDPDPEAPAQQDPSQR
jgi:pyruvate kinase